MGVELQASDRTHTDTEMKVLLTLLLLGALLAAAEGKRRGGKPKKARSGRGGDRSWHVAGDGGEESCGNSTEIFTTETPSSLCSEVGNNFCICVTRGDLEKEDAEVTWKFTCGSCEMKWKPEREEEAGKEEDFGGSEGEEEGDEDEDEAEAEGAGGQAGEDEEEEAEPQSFDGKSNRV